MKQFTINIKVDNNKLETIIDNPMSLDEWMNISATMTLDFLNQVINQATSKEAKEELKEYLFDQANEVFSTVLAAFAPDIDMRPDITEQAIMELELKNLNQNNKSKSKSKSKPNLEVIRNKR